MKKSKGRLGRQLAQKAKKRASMRRARLMAEQLESRVLLASDIDLTPHLAYLDSDEYSGHTNVFNANDVNANGSADLADTMTLFDKMRLLMETTGSLTYDFDPASLTTATGEGDSAPASLVMDSSNENLYLDVNGDGIFSPGDLFSNITYLREAAEGENHVEAGYHFRLFDDANPAFIHDVGTTQGIPNPGAQLLTEFRVNEAGHLTVGVSDFRDIPDEDKGVGSYYLNFAFTQGFPLQVNARDGAVDDAFVFNASESFGDVFETGEVFNSLVSPLGVENLGSADLGNFDLNGPTFDFADMSLTFSGAKLIALDDLEGVVQGDSVNVDVLDNDELHDQFTVTGSAPTDATALITVFQNGDEPESIDYGTATFDVRGPSGEILVMAITDVGVDTAPAKGTATLNNNGTSDPSDDFIVYEADAGASGTDTFTYALTDGFTKQVATVTIEIGERNDPPVIVAPASVTTQENTLVAVSGVSVSDPDAGSADMTVTLSATSGNLTVDTTGLTSSSGSGTTSVTLTGSQTALSTSLGTLTYAPIGEFSGSDTININANDNGNTGVPGPRTDSAAIAVTVQAVNDPPVNTLPAGPLGVFNTETLLIDTISIDDIDAGSGDLLMTFSVNDGTITLNSTTGLVVTNNGQATVTAQGTLADLNAALAVGITYDPIDTLIGTDTLTVTTNDLGNTPAPAEETTDSVDIDVTPPKLPFARDDEATVAEDTPGGVAISIFANDLNGLIEVGGKDLSLQSPNPFTQPTNGSVTYDDRGNADPTDDVFVYEPDAHFFGTDTFTYTIVDLENTPNDGPDTGTVTVTVTPVNDAPTIAAPTGTISTPEDNQVAITPLSVDDIDAGSGILTVTLTSTNGTMQITPGGATASSSDAAAITLNGTLAQLNGALATLFYTPALNYNGPAEVDVNINDNGLTGGGDLTADATISIDVTAENDAPTISNPGDQFITKDFVFVFDNSTGVISIEDVDAGANDLTMMLTISTAAGDIGSISLGTPNTVDVTASTPTSITFDGTVSEINQALDGLTYAPGAAFVGDVLLEFEVNDNGHSGDGGPLSASDDLTIEVLDFIPSLLSGYVHLDLNDDGAKHSLEKGIGGIEVHLQGVDITGTTIDRMIETDPAGYYEFANLAPPQAGTDGYTISIDASEASHYIDGKDTIGTQGGSSSANSLLVPTSVFLVNGQPLGGVTGAGNNFGFRGANAAYVDIWQFILASSHQDPSNGPVGRLLLSVDSAGNANNWIDCGGWSAYNDYDLTDTTPLSATLTAENGATSIFGLDFPEVRMIGDDGQGNTLYWIEGTPAELSSNDGEGEGESADIDMESNYDVDALIAATEREARDFEEAVDEVFANGDFA